MTILFVAGVFLGLFADLYKWITCKGRRRQAKTRTSPVPALADLFFWLISLFAIGPIFFFANWLELRFYVWFSIGCGLGAYYLLFHRPLGTLFGIFFE